MYHEDIIVNAAEDLSKFAKYPEGQYIELVHNSGKNAILTKGLPIPVEWYDENERRLTGNGYPDTLTAGIVIGEDTEDFPVGPATENLPVWREKSSPIRHPPVMNTGSKTGAMKPIKCVTAGGAMDKQQFIRSQSTKPLTTNAFTNGEMTLIGWNTVPDGSGSACPPTRRRGMPSPA